MLRILSVSKSTLPPNNFSDTRQNQGVHPRNRRSLPVLRDGLPALLNESGDARILSYRQRTGFPFLENHHAGCRHAFFASAALWA